MSVYFLCMEAPETYVPRPIRRTWESFGGCCSRCKGPNDPYMVTFKLWAEIIPKEERRELICLKCFEKALGRELDRADFIHDLNRFGQPCPINYGFFGFHVDEFLKERRNS